MANILLGDIRVYGKEENISAFVEDLKEYLDMSEMTYEYKDIQGRVIERNYTGEFRWNIENTLTKPEVLELTKKYHVGVDAKGHEPGIGFFEYVAVYSGQILQSDSWAIDIADTGYFDPYQEEA